MILMADSLDYWLERAQNTINSELIEDAKAAAELQRIVTLMYAEIAKELLAFYAKYATAEGLTIAEAKKIVDEFDVVAFQNKAKALVKNKDFSKEANKQLKKYNTKMYVSREKLLKQNLDLLVTEASIKVENHIEKSLVKAIDREVERQSGILGTDINVTDKKIKAVVNSSFKGVTWSERLWDDMDLVRKEVERVATNVVNRGRHPNEYVADFKKKTGATTHDAKRLLVTESARVQTEAQKLSYLETLGEDGEYEFVAKRDEKTSKVCRHHDKKVYKVKDMVPGVNAPPMHPHCRSTTIPRLGNWRDDFFKKRKGKYRLKDENITRPIIKESGALNDNNDPYMKKRIRHATTYYNSVRNRRKDIEIEKIAENTGFKRNTIKRVYEHIFENEYNLANGFQRFAPDFDMANSWSRLRDGKHIRDEDLIMLHHEALEHYLMNKYNYSYRDAHRVVVKKYDYEKALKAREAEQ